MNTRSHDENRTFIEIDRIRVNDKKLRKLSNAKIAQHERCYENGDEFPPLIVQQCEGFYTINDGRHRYQAQRKAGYSHVMVVVRP